MTASAESSLADNLELLSLLTGISREHLGELRSGAIFPSESHRRALEQVLTADQVELFTAHVLDEFEGVRTIFGRTPDGTQLIPRMAANQVRAGDMLAYKKPSAARGSYWLLITGASTADGRVYLITESRIIELAETSQLKVARPS